VLENSFYIETYGCTSNKADSYIISDVLKKANYKETSLENAQFIIINTCGVKEQTENKIKARLENLHKLYHKSLNRHIIIAGCLPYIAPNYMEVVKKIIPSFAAIIDLNNIIEIPEILNDIKNGKRNLITKSAKSIDKAKYYIDHSPGKITGIIPISEGCLGSCTYCCVKNARGKLNCYKPKSIIENVEYQLEQRIKQIYLTSQDCSIYDNNGITLAGLVRKIADLDYKFFLRIGMINPRFLIENIDQLISIFNQEKIYQFLHITVNFIKWLKPEILNISKFTPRPGTKAKKMEQLNSRTIKERSIRLSRVFRNSLTDINKNWENWEGEVLILHEGTKPNQVFSRNFAYKNIFIDNYQGGFGNFIQVKIVRIEGFNLYGIPISSK